MEKAWIVLSGGGKKTADKAMIWGPEGARKARVVFGLVEREFPGLEEALGWAQEVVDAGRTDRETAGEHTL